MYTNETVGLNMSNYTLKIELKKWFLCIWEMGAISLKIDIL